MYRKNDLQFLQDIFDRSSNDIALLYGSRSVGLTELVLDLIKDKECLYYRAGQVTETAQRELFAAELHEQTRSPIVPNDDYEKLLGSFINEGTDKKKMIVFDDFQHLVRENPTFVNFLSHLLFEKSRQGLAMILLVSSDVRFVESDMIRLIGRKSSEISGVLKLNEYTPTEFRKCFPNMPLSSFVGIYSFLGGKSMFYDDIAEDMTLTDVVISQLKKCEDDYFDINMFLPQEIREPSLYNTILIYLAQGKGKLNDLHELTGTDRAKLSVYLKTLIENDMVEKAGTAFYRIKDRVIRFYYRYVIPHISSLHIMGAQRFYRRYIEGDIASFVEEAYPLYCMEHIRWLQKENRLNFRVASIEEYFDKYKAIDFIITVAGSSVIACACRYSGGHMGTKTLDDVRASIKKNRLNCDNIWLFSAQGFDQKLSAAADETPGIKLVEGTGQRPI